MELIFGKLDGTSDGLGLKSLNLFQATQITTTEATLCRNDSNAHFIETGLFAMDRNSSKKK